MSADEPGGAPTPESIAAFVRKNAPKFKKSGMMMMHGDPEVVREEDYKGHHIMIRTTYHIEVDGKPVTGHLTVTNDGEVQAHSLPNYTFDSAMGLIEKLIDKFPEDFGPDASPETPEHHEMPPMSGSGMKMPGMKMPGMKMKKAPAKAAKPAPSKTKTKNKKKSR